MRILARVLVIGLLFIVSSVMILNMIGHNVHLSELNSAIATAMTQTQLLKEENIQDEMYGTSISRTQLTTATAYRNQYIDHFAKLVGAETKHFTSDSQTRVELLGGELTERIDTNRDGRTDTDVNQGTSTKYVLTFYTTDPQKGLLSVGVEGEFTLNGRQKHIYSQKTSLIEVDDSMQEVVTITFQANSGLINENGTDQTTVTREYTSGEVYGTLPIPKRSGYVFDGWYTSRTGGTRISESSTVTTTRTLYAHWQAE